VIQCIHAIGSPLTIHRASVFTLLLAAGACGPGSPPEVAVTPEALGAFGPLASIPEFADNTAPHERVALGRMLYHEKRISAGGKVSCYSCHPLHVYGTSHRRTGPGRGGGRVGRDEPSVFNATGQVAEFWDGRAPDLESAVLISILNPIEMDMPDATSVVKVLSQLPEYVRAFAAAFPGEARPITIDNVGHAIAAFERGLVTPSRWDAFLQGDARALTNPERRGFNDFVAAGCPQCHGGALVGGASYQRAGQVETWYDTSDRGRAATTHDETDDMVFKVPPLRDVAETGPYFHDGSIPRLQDAISLMGWHQLGSKLTRDQIERITTWLRTLSGPLPYDYINGPDRTVLDASRRGRLDSALREAVEAGKVPGVVAVVTTRDSIVYRGAFGVMDASGQQPMRPDAIFEIASMTKPITSVGLMKLVETGAVDLDAPASDYLPELRNREVLVTVDIEASTFSTRPADRPITVRDLLRQTSGIGYSFASRELLELSEVTDLPDRAWPILHDPGTRWTYGMGPAFVGWIVEEVSGRSLSDFLESEVLRPLGMDHTSFGLTPYDSTRLVATYRRTSAGLEGLPRPAQYHPMIRGDGGLLSTGEDYAHFIQMILNGGQRRGVRVLSEQSISRMTRDQLNGLVVVEQPAARPDWSRPFPLGAGRDGFGLGFEIQMGFEEDRPSPGSLSWAGNKNTFFWIDVEDQLGVVLLLQVVPFYDESVIHLLTEVQDVLYGDTDERVRLGG